MFKIWNWTFYGEKTKYNGSLYFYVPNLSHIKIACRDWKIIPTKKPINKVHPPINIEFPFVFYNFIKMADIESGLSKESHNLCPLGNLLGLLGLEIYLVHDILPHPIDRCSGYSWLGVLRLPNCIFLQDCPFDVGDSITWKPQSFYNLLWYNLSQTNTWDCDRMTLKLLLS